jgi:hypothetical protein
LKSFAALLPLQTRILMLLGMGTFISNIYSASYDDSMPKGRKYQNKL